MLLGDGQCRGWYGHLDLLQSFDGQQVSAAQRRVELALARILLRKARENSQNQRPDQRTHGGQQVHEPGSKVIIRYVYRGGGIGGAWRQ